jgi:hypothetical protein
MGDLVANRPLYEDSRAAAGLGCPKEESDQVAQAIRACGGVVEYKFYEEKGHSFSKTALSAPWRSSTNI